MTPRSALHVALRALRDASFLVDGEVVVPQNIVNIGIGGSDLGPAALSWTCCAELDLLR